MDSYPAHSGELDGRHVPPDRDPLVREAAEGRVRAGGRYRAEAGIGLLMVGLAAMLVLMCSGRILGREGVLLPSPRSIVVSTPRVVILKSKRVLHLFEGDRLVRTYPIDLGISPLGSKLHQHDGRTPEGRFRVVTKNPDSAYHRFLGIDYPGIEGLERGLARGLVSEGEAAAIRAAHGEGRCPDWGTALGGGIGIHGGGRGWDWTGGCVAISDRDIEELFQVLRVGDPIEILP